MGWQGDDDLVTRTIANWHGGRLPVGAGQGATMDAASEPGPTSAARAPMTDAEWDASIWRSLAGLRDWPPLEIDYHTVSAALDERIALRAAVARLEAAEACRKEQIAALIAERDAARAALDGLLADLEHFAQTSHQAHHGAYAATWQECPRGSCPGLRRAVARARAASDGGER